MYIFRFCWIFLVTAQANQAQASESRSGAELSLATKFGQGISKLDSN